MTLPEISSMFGSLPSHGPGGTGLGPYTPRLHLDDSPRGNRAPPPGEAARCPWTCRWPERWRSPGRPRNVSVSDTASTVTSLSADTDSPSSPNNNNNNNNTYNINHNDHQTQVSPFVSIILDPAFSYKDGLGTKGSVTSSATTHTSVTPNRFLRFKIIENNVKCSVIEWTLVLSSF